MENFKTSTDSLIVNYLMNSATLEFKDFDLIQANHDLQNLFRATMKMYFSLKKINPDNIIKHESGTWFIDSTPKVE
jgi:hypothetical protein